MHELESYVVNQMSKSMLINDGSSDCGLKKMNGACAITFDVK